MRYRAALIATPIVILLAAVASLSAAPVRQFISPAPDTVPEIITYQGVLTDANGAGVNNGSYLATFRMYTSSTGGSSVWSETHNINVQNGLFSIALGTRSDILTALEKGSNLYLGITVGSGPELRPRQPITSVPFAVRAKDAETLNGSDAQNIVDAAMTSSRDGDAHTRCDIERRLVNSVDSYLPSKDCLPAQHRIITDAANPINPKIAIQSDGSPVIASVIYSGQLYVTECGDIECEIFVSRPVTELGETLVEGQISLVLDSQDRASLTYYDSMTQALYLVACIDAGCKEYTTTRLVNENSLEGLSNALTLSQADLPRIMYSRRQFGLRTAAKIVCADRMCENLSIRAGSGGTSSQVEYFMDAITRGDGRPVFSYYWESQRRTSLDLCMEEGCESSYGGRIGVVLEDVTGTALAVSSDDAVAAAATDGDKLYYIVCPTLTCSPRTDADPTGQGFVVKSIRPASSNGTEHMVLGLSMAMLPDDTPLFAYIDNDFGAVVARCDTLDCSNMPEPVRISVGASGGTDIAIGPDGVPIIVFIDNDPESNNVLRPYIIRCEQCMDW